VDVHLALLNDVDAITQRIARIRNQLVQDCFDVKAQDSRAEAG
jgi:hypothetical protein